MTSSPSPATPDAPPRFSIVTVCLNSAATIADTVRSVREQTGVTLEHIVKDAGSRDGTLDVACAANPEVKAIACPDAGIYDAMNQGLAHATGEFVAFLNSDDYYTGPDVLRRVAEEFDRTGADLVHAGIVLIDSAGRAARQWPARPLPPRSLPHPGVFVRRAALSRLQPAFDPSYRISADLKQQLLLVEKLGVPTADLPLTVTAMRMGGESTRSFRTIRRGWSESLRAYREVHGRSGLVYVVRKVASKLRQVNLAARLSPRR
jgi:glycosyltransferase involved in cell wall biosynthesis